MTSNRGGRSSRVLRLVGVPLGAVLVVLGVLAGYLDHVLLDGPTFAAKVDTMRQTPAVSSALGHSLTDRYLASEPNLVALRPLVLTVATSVVGSSALSGPTRAAAGSFQRAATEPHADLLVLRVADAGAVLTSVLAKALPPGQTTRPATVSLQLARIGGQTWSGRTIKAARYLRLARWLMPAAGLVLLALSVYAAPRRRRTMLAVGAAVLGVTAAVAVLLLVAGRVAAQQDQATVTGALIRAGWVELVRPVWWWLGVLALLALMVVASAGALLPEYDASAVIRRVWHVVADRPRRFALDLVRSLVFVVAGVGTLIDPLTAVKVIGTLIGAALILYGLAELARATNDEDLTAARLRRGARAGQARPGLVVAAALVLVLGAYAVWLGGSTQPAVAVSGPVTGKGLVCDGYAALCSRPFTDVSFAASHNAMSVAGQPGWFLGEQGVPITSQLDNGVRALLIDVWPGQPRRDGGVATAPGSYAEARAVATKELGAETVDAGLRVFHTLADPTPAGPVAMYLCHGLCELGGTNLIAAMQGVREWLDTNPDETLSIVIEAHAPSDQIGAALTASGLASYAFTPTVGGPWPTLHQMITSGHRLMVMMESGSGGSAYPWIVNGYQTFLQETPYTFHTAADFSCRPNRGPATAPLFLVNHWLDSFSALVTNARQVNTMAVLGARVEQCRTQRQRPTFVAVNYADIGDLQEVVNRLNGVGGH